MDSTSDTVLLLNVDLGEMEMLLLECKVVFNVSLGGSINEVTHLESLDGFILGDNFSAVMASDYVSMTLVILASSVISSFGWHNLIIQNSNNTPF